MSQSTGKLFVVATPIGNLADMTSRAVEALKTADLIIAEDTRRTATLLSHFGIDTPLESYHADSSEATRQRLIERIASGLIAALLTDAGTPGISDPGAEFVSEAAAAGVDVSPIPGPSAITAALSVSGLNADRFIFLGYPPRKSAQRETFLTEALAHTCTIVLFEAPHRIVDTITELAEIAPDRPAFIARELTKHFEELSRGTLAEIRRLIEAREPRGEYVIVCAGASESTEDEIATSHIRRAVAEMSKAGLRTREIADILSILTPLSRNEAYDAALRYSHEDG